MRSSDQPDDRPGDRPTPAELAELAEYVALPSVSRDGDPAVMAATAAWLAERFALAGARVRPTAGNPVVTGRLEGPPGAPVVLVYGHYDVQPTGDRASWRTDPFTLAVEEAAPEAGGEAVARGRGATDDKAPVLVVLAALRELVAGGAAPPVTVQLLLEGEEEVGSPHLAAWVAEHAEELACDLVLSADGGMWRPDEPSLLLASKGLVAWDVTVTGPARDLHSGRYGGTVANPVHALAALLASLHGADGAVAVDGFLDGVAEPTPAERSALASLAFDEAAYAADLGVPETAGEVGRSTLERLWYRPTLEVNGISGGGRYTVVPREASAHLTARLVAGQDAAAVAAVVRDHLLARAPRGVRVEVVVEPGGVPAYAVAADHPAVVCAREALEEVYPGQPVLDARMGGTVPATALFEQVLGVKTLFFCFATGDELHHAPNEFFRLRRWGEGVRATTSLLRRLATALPAGA